MVLSDILFDRSDCRFLLGERYAGREIRSIHLIASIHDLPHMERSSLLFVTPSFFSRPFPLSLFFSLVIQANVAGVALVGQAELSLPPALREQLLDREIFILSLPAGIHYHSIPQLQSRIRAAEDLTARNEFRRELSALCAGPYTEQDIAVLLNRRIGHPVDLIVGRDLHDVIRHNTLGIMNVTSVIQQNLEKILSEPHPQVYGYYNSRALVIRIGSLYAFLAIPLKTRDCLTDLEFFYIEEAIPYLTLALSRSVPPRPPLSVPDFYLSLLRGAPAGDPLALREKASLLGIRHDLPRYVWILDCGRALSGSESAALSGTVLSLFPGSFVHNLPSRLVILTAVPQLRLLEQPPAAVLGSCLSLLRPFHPDLSFRISISRCCPNLEHLKSAYSEAKFAMIIGPELDPDQGDLRLSGLYSLPHPL